MNLAKIEDPRNLVKIDPAVEAAEACAALKDPTRDEVVAKWGASPLEPAFREFLEINRAAVVAQMGIPPIAAVDVRRAGYSSHAVDAAHFAEMQIVYRRQFVDDTFLTPMFVLIERIAQNWSATAYAFACDEYLAEFGRLPGSERTSRLRKKRRDRVLRWFANDYLPRTFGTGEK